MSFDPMSPNAGITQRIRALIKGFFGLVGLGVLLTFTPLSYYYGLPLRVETHPQKSDVIVLMSHGQINRQWLSLEGSQRTLAAMRLYRMGYAPFIISSGSNLSDHKDQAGLQAEWLEAAGVPHDALIVERNSTRTYESVVEVTKILAARGWTTAVVVASEMDIPRIRAIFDKLGVRGISFEEVPEFRKPSMPTLDYPSGWNVFYHATYEYLGLVYYKWKGWI